jgi:hypothetical protein
MTRNILLLSLAVATSFAAPARAAVTTADGKDGGETVVRMTVTPAAEPNPALRYRLVPRELDLKTGNAAPYYYRAALELQPTMKTIREKFNNDTELSQWAETGDGVTPIAELPLDKVRQASQLFDPVYSNHLKPGFERNGCDWQLNIEELRGADIFSMHLNEFRDCREMARMMRLRTRLAIAEHRYDDAVELMRQSYRLGSDVTKVPFVVNGLIGIAIDGMTNQTMVEFIANPGSPNMFWALGELPDPAIDLRPALRFEMDFGPRLLTFMHNAETTDHSPQEWNLQFKQALCELQNAGASGALFGGIGSTQADPSVGLAATAFGLAGYTHAKARLAAEGMDPKKLEKMAVGQVIAIYCERSYRSFAEDWERIWQVPFAQTAQVSARLDKRLAEARPLGDGDNREILPIATLLLPALQSSRETQVRLQREIASLRVIEALRLYAAAHDGKFPDLLEDINEVPVPNNPATGKPFMYRLDGATAIVELPNSDRLKGGNCRYEIQIAAKK